MDPIGNQPWIVIGRTDAEAEAPIPWLPDVKSWFISKDPESGKDWRQEEKGTTEDLMVGWHHWLYGHEFKQALGDGEGLGSLSRHSPWGYKELDMTEWLNSDNLVTRNLLPNISWGFPASSDIKVSARNVWDLGLIPGWGRSPGEGHDNPLQYPCLENHKDRGAW